MYKLAILFLFSISMQYIAVSKNQDLVTTNSNIFIENKGQWDNTMKFVSFNPGLNVIIKENKIFYDNYQIFKQNDIKKITGDVFTTEFVNSNQFKVKGTEITPIRFNYFKGNNPDKWISNASTFKSITLENVYDGIDVLMSFTDGKPRYDFIVLPGANPNEIKLKYDGNLSLNVNSGSITLESNDMKIVHSSLLAYQEINGQKEIINCSFEIEAIENQKVIKFIIGNYDKSKSLIIDPTIYAQYIGGTGQDWATSIKYSTDKYFVTAGVTKSTDLNTTPGVYDNTFSGDQDLFVAKYYVTLSERQLIFLTLLGGSLTDNVAGIAVDPDGDIYLTGSTTSSDFPVQTAFNTTFGGSTDAFITKLKSDGSKLLYSGFLGGGKDDYATSICVTTSKNAFVAGYTNSTNFQIAGGATQTKLKGLNDAFLTKVNASGSSLEYSTYWGGSNDDKAWGLAVEEDGSSYLVGETTSGDFPIFPWRVDNHGRPVDFPYDYTYNGGKDAFAVKISASNGGTEYSTYFGGTADDIATCVSFLSDGSLVIGGTTAPETTVKFPVSANAYQKTLKGGIDCFVARLDKVKVGTDGKGQALIFSTYIGGSSDDILNSIIYDSYSDNFILCGSTKSNNFPVKGDEATTKFIGKSDAFIAKLNITATDVPWASYFGGINEDYGTCVDVSTEGDIIFCGNTASPEFIKDNKYYGGTSDAFIIKFLFNNLLVLSPIAKDKFCANSNVDLRYQTSGFASDEKFEARYKLDANSPWVTIPNTAQNGLCKWSVPDVSTQMDSVQIAFVHKSGLVVKTALFSVMASPKATIVSTEPSGGVACEGDSLYIINNVTGNNTSFKWYQNGVLIPNQTQKDLLINKLTPANSGKYKLTVSGICKPDVTTTEFNLLVNPATKIVTDPQNVVVKKGGSAEFKVEATGLDLTYQWLRNGEKILAANQINYVINDVSKSHEANYSCEVTGKCGKQISAVAELKIDTNSTSVIVDNLKNSINIEVISETSDEVTLKVTNSNELLPDLKIINLLGEISSELVIQNNIISINKKTLNTGIYFLANGNNLINSIYKLAIIK